MNQQEKAQSNVSLKSKEYKDECRQLLERIVTLQLKVFKAPDLYIKEVLNVVQQYKEQYESVKLNPGQNNGKFAILIQFLSKVAVYYKTDLHFYIEDLFELINHFQDQLHPNIRKKIIFCLLRLRGKNLIEPFRMIVFLMKMFNCQDKDLRRIIYRFIIKDIKLFNKKHKNEALNKQIQNFIIDLIKRSSENIAKRAIQIMIELYRRNIWRDSKCVNIIAQGCFSQNYKIKLLASYFLIETTETRVEMESSSEDEGDKYIQKKGKNKCVKPTKAREHRLNREKKQADKKQRKKLQQLNNKIGFFALDLIYSAQDFSERLFESLKKHDHEKFQVKLAIMHLLSRLIHRHKLQLIPYYSFIQKHLYPNGKELGKLFAYLAESVHDQIPKDDLQPIIKHIIDQFINDRCQEQTLTMGLRGIYEMLQKHPKLLDKENVNYLVYYIKYKNRNVSQAARSIMNYFKDNNPQLLDKRLRGNKWKSTEEIEGEDEENDMIYSTINQGIDGAELLQQEEEEKYGKKYNMPIYCERILTDEDFKRIRALKRKKEAEQEQEKLQSNNIEDEEDEELEEESNSNENELSEISGEELDSEWENEEEEQDDEWEDDNENDEELDNQQIQSKKTKEENKKRRQSLSELENSEEDSVQDYYSDESQDSQENPLGYVNEEDILKYKKTKQEDKKDKLEQKQNGTKERWYQGPAKKKSEFASTSNKEKLKHKPLQMMRAKKVQQKSKESRLKSNIKDLKNKLGHVRSGKQAKRLKKIRAK